ncbi:MAG: hypothetical protein CMD16_02840 [Flavobacteriales bacterium]|nr:hypothetical protein [Flavobacteriales bacterium]
MQTLFKTCFLILAPFYVFSQNNTFRSLIETQFTNFPTDTSNYISIAPNVYAVSSFNKESDISNIFLLRATLTSNISNNLTVISYFDYLAVNSNYLIKEYQDSLGIFPGFGLDDKRIQYNFRYKINKFISADLGNGKQFIGNGYQSLLLSDIASPYPYLRLTTEFGRVKYYNLYTTFINPYMSDFGRKKHSTIHYLDFAISKNINLGVFESILWQSKSEELNKGYELAYLNPVIFYRPVEFSKYSSKGNALMGSNFSINFKAMTLYGQFLLDDLNISRQKDRDDDYEKGFFQNKYAYQIGLKGNIKDVNFLLEYNQVQPYTYGHRTILQNYSHMNQALAHPLGANFKEMINVLELRKGKWSYKIKTMFTIVGLDSLGSHYGQDIFASDKDASTGGQYSYGNFNGQGVKTTIFSFQPEVSFSIKQFEVFGMVYYRTKKSDLLDQSFLFYSVGFRTFPFMNFIDY